MLVLSRRLGEEIVIGGNIHITVISTQGERVRLGITAPRSVRVDRQEVFERRFVTDGQLYETAAVECACEDISGVLSTSHD